MGQTSFVNHRRTDVNYFFDVVLQHALENVLMQNNIFRQNICRKFMKAADTVNQSRSLYDCLNIFRYFFDKSLVNQIADYKFIIPVSFNLSVSYKTINPLDLITL